ncbi:MAG: YbhB/YbcL family Raf kinase inhibitor-like protein [candidate division Zixibacteria bacterium]|nr:YbhB/YbcL family Raf kinase inhibitor-like protein [candidate division Zixibacteria bacterium]
MFKAFTNILILLLLFSAIAYGEYNNGKIRGVVTDSLTGEPILGASILVIGTNIGAMTNPKGEFCTRPFEAGICSLRITSIGYKTKKLSDIEVLSDKTTLLNIGLHKSVTDLDKVVRVTGVKKGGGRKPRIELISKVWISQPDEHYKWIPKKYTCGGANVSPPLQIQHKLNKIKSLAIICNSTNEQGETKTHWVICNIPQDITELPENIEKVLRPSIGQGTSDIQPIQGLNDFGEIGYTGPCPQNDSTYRYNYYIYALNKKLVFSKRMIKNGITAKKLLKAIGKGSYYRPALVGKYKR